VTLNVPHNTTLRPLSEIPTPDPADFPPLSGKPFSDMWTTVTKRSKKKKATGPLTPAVPTPPLVSVSPSGLTSFVAAAASSTTPPFTSTPTSKACPIKPCIQDTLRSTRYSIILNHSHLDIHEMLGIDTGCNFHNIRANLERINAPLTLLAGHWSSTTINKNFILTFAGLQKWDDIAKYDTIFFRPFGPDCCGAPTAGYRTALLYSVPLVRDLAGCLPSPHDLDQEIGWNAAFKGVLSLAPPRWLYNPDRIELD
jgi:hypothetical protein